MIIIDLTNSIREQDNYIVDKKSAIEFIIRDIKEKKLIPYVNLIYFGNTNNDVPAVYDLTWNAIILNHEGIIEKSKKMANRLAEKYSVSDREKMYLVNYAYLCYLSHVINLVVQEKKYQTDAENGVFTRLHNLKMSDSDRVNSPMNLLASNNALYEGYYDVFRSMHLPIVDLLHLEYLQGLIENYEETSDGIVSPIDRLTIQDGLDDKDSIVKAYSSNERLKMGLWVTPEELDIEKRKVKELRGRCKRYIKEN